MAEQMLSGGRHCGMVRFEAELDLDNTIECNCSICTKRGSILTFPRREKFRVTEGEESTSSYKFGQHVIDHRFCRQCGVAAFAEGRMPDGTPMAAVNVRCLDDIDLAALHPHAVRGPEPVTTRPYGGEDRTENVERAAVWPAALSERRRVGGRVGAAPSGQVG